MSSSTAAEIEKVRHHLGGNLVIDDLSMSIPSGSIHGLIGPNGSGKTTTMRLLLRIYDPDEGTVRVFGESGGRSDQLRIGYLPEERGLYPRMTVEKTLLFFAKLRGVEDGKAEMQRWLERLGVTDWSGKRVEQLSKGMGQKIQFIAAAMGKPRLVILDEPFSGLDPVNLDLLREAVKQLRDEGTTVILSTHDMAVAQQMCDRVAMIYRGRKVLDGDIQSIRREYGAPRLRIQLGASDGAAVEPGTGTDEKEPGRNGSKQSKMKEAVASALTSMHGVNVLAAADHESVEVSLEDINHRGEVLQKLSGQFDVETFETVRPSLHDIFVQIAGPEATQNPSPEA
ncbi:MAG: ATP-binding cassette domain-containing protein [Planctomycetota bacterium]